MRTGDFSPFMWLPKFYGSPDVAYVGEEDFPMTFEAVLADYCRTDDVTYRWSSSSDNVHIVSPNDSVTEVTIDSLPRWKRFSLMVEAYVGNVALTSTLTTTCGEYRDPRAALALSVPEVMFVNNDDDDGDGFEDNGPSTADEDDVATCTFTLTCPTAISGTLTFVDVTGFTGDIYEQTSSDTYSLVNPGDSWSLSGSSYRKAFRLDAKGKSTGYRQSKIKLRWTPDNGETQDIEHRFTVAEPIVEPICNERKSVTENGVARTLTVNPCGVGIGRDAYFRVQVLPQSVPDSQIVWSAVGAGSVSFPNGNTGGEVKVRGVSAGEVDLRVLIGNCESSAPSFPLRVVTNKVVKLSAWIVENDDGISAYSPDDVRRLVKDAEDVYVQVGVTFDLGDRIVVTNIQEAFELRTGYHPTAFTFSNLVDVAHNTGGIECYFVGKILSPDSRIRRGLKTGGVHNRGGLAVPAGSSGIVLAHEIGHAFGLSDIYEIELNDKNQVEYVCKSNMPDDWNGGCDGNGQCGMRYYRAGMLQRDAIQRMLMNGETCVEDEYKCRDITAGYVRGLLQSSEFHNSRRGAADVGFYYPSFLRLRA